MNDGNQLAVVVVEPGRVELRQLPLPPLRPDEVMVRATRTVISAGTEMAVFAHRYAPANILAQWVKYPFVGPGYCHAGRVVAVGDAVRTLKPGDRVVSRAGHLSPAIIPEASTLLIPQGVTDADAAWARLAMIAYTAFMAHQPALGDSIVIVGAGQIGLLTTQLASLTGARDVVVIDLMSDRLDRARRLGATHTIQTSAAQAWDEIMRITDRRGADMVVEATGVPRVWVECQDLARDRGTIVALGSTSDPWAAGLSTGFQHRGLRLVSAHAHLPPLSPNPYQPWDVLHIYQLFFHYLLRGGMRVDEMVSHRFPVRRIGEAYDLLRHQPEKALGVVLEWDDAT